MTLRMEYVAPDGTIIAFTDEADAPYFLLDTDGLLSSRITPYTAMSPGQYGETLADVSVAARRVALSVWITAGTESLAWQYRAQLAAALLVLPAAVGAQVEHGILRVYRPGLPVVEADAVPEDSPQDKVIGPQAFQSDIQFYLPNPFWRDIEDRSDVLTPAGSLTFPVTMPLEFPSTDTQVEAYNAGTVATSVIMRIYGGVDTPRMSNDTTGETIELDTVIADGDYAEIDTAFGNKSVTLHAADGTVTSIMDKVTLSKSDFWLLRPGTQTITFTGNNVTTGYAEIVWRQRYAGI